MSLKKSAAELLHMQILINLAVLAVALAVVATLACIAAGRDGR